VVVAGLAVLAGRVLLEPRLLVAPVEPEVGDLAGRGARDRGGGAVGGDHVAAGRPGALEQRLQVTVLVETGVPDLDEHRRRRVGLEDRVEALEHGLGLGVVRELG
jgi:hypothetical protein